MLTETAPKIKIFEPITDGKTEEIVGMIIRPQSIKNISVRENLLEIIVRGQIIDPTPRIITISDAQGNPFSIISYEKLRAIAQLTEKDREKEISLLIYRKGMLNAKMITIDTIQLIPVKQLPWQPKLF